MSNRDWQWFRWYDGTVRDGKFQIVSRISGLPVCTVIGVWASLLEDASTSETRGVADSGLEYHSMWLGIAPHEIGTAWNAMERSGLVHINGEVVTIINWAARQFETDSKDPTAKTRKDKWKQKRKADRTTLERNGTVLERPGTPETETETETETEKKKDGAIAPSDPRTELFQRGLEALSRMSGKTPSSVRSLVGRWLKAVDDEAIHVLAAIDDAATDRIVDPIPWIEARLRPKFKTRNTNGQGNVLAAADRLIERVQQFNRPAPAEGALRIGASPAPVRAIPKG